MIEIRWHGRGGQGAFTAAKLLGVSAALFEGKQALAFPSFGPERRGAPVLAFTKIDDDKIQDRSEMQQCDYIVILDPTLFQPQYIEHLKLGGKILINSPISAPYENWKEQVICFDAASTAEEILKKPIVNTAMLAALSAFTGVVTLQSLRSGIEEGMTSSLALKNIDVVNEVFKKIGGSYHD